MVGETAERHAPSHSGAANRVHVSLLGGFRVRVGSRVVEDQAWRSRKGATLVKLLALAPHHRLHREQLFEHLWPDLLPLAAGNNLHHTLHVARRILGDAGSSCLSLQNDQVSLGSASSVWTDVEAFETAVSTARRTGDLASHRAARDLYVGDLLPGDVYEEWSWSRREELRILFISLLLSLARLADERGARDEAVESLQRAISCDPTLEEAHVALMHVYSRSGQRQQAIRQFEQLRETLERELDTEPEASSRQVYEDVLAGRIPAAMAPPVQTAAPKFRRDNLPASLTSFIGRQSEVARVREIVTSSRLLTLTGAGGSGKTRLSQQGARHLLLDFRDGIWLVELAALACGAEVAPSAARALSIEERAGDSLISTMLEVLAPKQLLLILDNCEHVIEAAASLAEAILTACPGVRILATSREPLGIPGEIVWPLAPLALPSSAAPLMVEELQDIEAIQLFVERATARQPAFSLTAQNAADIAEICRRLDGLPLAIELAAARVGVLSPEQIASRLGNALALLTTGSRTAEPRRQTLRGALDWSYDLLEEAERVLLRRLAVFVGGWTLEAAEAIAVDAPGGPDKVLDLLSHLVDKSLVVAEPTPSGAVRYTMLEPVRQYALELLMSDPTVTNVQHRHARFFAELGDEAHVGLTGPDQLAWFERLEQEHDNLRAALRHSIDHGEVETSLRLAGAIWRFWATRGHASEGKRFMEEVLSLPRGDTVEPEIRARALNGAGALAYYQGDYADAMSQYEAALAVRREIGDLAGVSRVLGNLGLVAKEQGEFERAAALHQESLDLARALDNKLSQAATLNNLGILTQEQGQYERAAALHQESLALMRELGDLHGIVNSFNNLGAIALDRGEYRQAGEFGEQALAMAREIGARRSTGVALINLGRVAQEQGEYETSRARLLEAIQVMEPTGDTEQAAGCLKEWATLACVEGRHRRAATLYGAAAALRKASGSRLNPQEQARFDAKMGAVRAALPAHTFEAAFQKGAAMKLEEAFAFARSIEKSEQCAQRVPLTRREDEIARLLAKGRTNRQIAEELGIAERTVDTHVERILRKLGVSSRTHVAATIGK